MDRPNISIADGPFLPTEVDEAAEVAMRAFLDDPFFCHLSPSEAQRERGLRIYMRTMFRNLGPGGRMMLARNQNRVIGVAAWVRPGGYPYPASTQVRQTLGVLWALAPRPAAIPAGWRYLSAVEKAHPKEEVWYLAVLAADPSIQRSGVGASLLGSVLAEADAEGFGVYLETQKEENLAYYRRHGFAMKETLAPVPKGPPLWTMARYPQG